jgi:Holliday junction resolvasome RuvABC endonuclease subunit
MKIPILGMDPSLTHWGLASSSLDLTTGIMDDPVNTLIVPDRLQHKQVRQNSKDLHEAEQLASIVFKLARQAKVIFAEVPVGSQSARAMASYGVCVGILGALRAEGIQVIEVTATEVKKALTGRSQATKREMINAAVALYPTSDFFARGGKIPDKAEHVADAIGAIHAGVNTSTFQNLMRLFQGL